MSNIRFSWFRPIAAAIVGLGLAMPAAYAFDPQPDPPAKTRGAPIPQPDKSKVLSDKKLGTVQPGPCAEATCQQPISTRSKK